MLPTSARIQETALLAVALTMVGCAQNAQIERRSIADLYQDAVHVARPAVHSGSIMTTTTRLATDGHATATLSDAPERIETGADNITDSIAEPLAIEAPGTMESFDAVEILDQVKLDESNISPLPLVGFASATEPVIQEALPLPDQSDGIRVSEYFDLTDVREAIEILAETTGDKVVVDDTVGGVITMEIENATFEEALKQVLLPLGYVYAKHEGTYVVSPPDPDAALFRYVSTNRQYVPNSHLPTKLVELLPARYVDFYQVSDERNLIVIDAPEQIAADILQRLQHLDRPVQQVVLEAIVCVTSPDSGFQFGMDWNHVLSLDDTNQVNVGLSGLSLSASASPYGLNNAFNEFAVTSAFVKLLSQEGYVTIRAQPSVTAKDGEKASISIARETFFSLQPTASNVLFRQDVQKVDAGITLEIIPRIRGDIVSVEIERAEVSEDIRSNGSNPALNNNPYPIINRRQVSTKVDVRDGHTIVIGGLIQRQTVDRVNKVPFLGSLPLIGTFFRTIEKQEQDAEVAIFISPRIVPYQ